MQARMQAYCLRRTQAHSTGKIQAVNAIELCRHDADSENIDKGCKDGSKVLLR